MESLSQRLFTAALAGVLGLVLYGQAQEHVVEPIRTTAAHLEQCLDAASGATPAYCQ